MHEAEAIALLRRMICAEPEQRPGEPYDPGWCCQEHAIVTSLALCCLGVRAQFTEGSALFVEQRRVLDVGFHSFTLVYENKRCLGVFDASAQFGPVAGISVGYADQYPNLFVSLYKSLPAGDVIFAKMQQAQKECAAMYEAKRAHVPNAETLRWVSETPFGHWLRTTVGSQAGIWGKAAVIVAQTFATGKPDNRPNGFNKLSQAELWRWVSQTPNADDFVARTLAAPSNESAISP